MTPLAPLYLLGALAVAGPILFHLWRRTPRGRREFSTLMFLTPSPPRVTSRSRIEHWLLLLLRGAVLCLLALAFARPLWRTATTEPEKAADEELVAVLVDTSASLRRDGTWPELIRRLNDQISKLPNSATIALYQFHDAWIPVADFAELKRREPETRREIVKSRLADLHPTWGSTNLAEALIRTAGALQEVQTDRSVPVKLRILLATDLQTGAALEGLHGFEWPSDLRVELLVAVTNSPSNAGLQIVERNQDLGDDVIRVRVTNSVDSRKEQFSLKWNANDSESESVYVPPGQSRVVIPPKRPIDGASSLKLTGDDHEFDNTVHFAPARKETRLVVYCGTDKADDSTGARFYLAGVYAASQRYQIELTGWQDVIAMTQAERPALVVLVEPDPGAGEFVKAYLLRGGTVLIASTTVQLTMESLKQCGLDDITLTEAAVKRDAMLSDIDFEHPLFAPFSEAQFSDFTGIRYWKHRTLPGFAAATGSGQVESRPHGVRVLARFDDGDPAFVEFSLAKGRVLLMTGSWQPADSQLARSSKFPPLMFRILEDAAGYTSQSEVAKVGAPIEWPKTGAVSSAKGTVRCPDGRLLSDVSINVPFTGSDQPGLYTFEADGRADVVAVNLRAEESRTALLPVEQLEGMGVRLGSVETKEDIRRAKDRERQLKIEELEHVQKLWRWGILIAILLLVTETWLAGRKVSVAHEPTE